MDVQDLLEFARQRYNAVGDEFFSDAELYRHVWAAQMVLAHEARVIERVYQTTTTASQQEYAYPTNTILIKRVTYDGNKLMPITFREDDTLTLNNSTTTATGTPQYYALWNETLYLRPIPDDALTLKVFSVSEPQEVTSNSTLEVPSMWHLGMADYLCWQMALKDKNLQAAAQYEKTWQATVQKAKRWQRLRLRGDALHSVKDEDSLPTTYIGAY